MKKYIILLSISLSLLSISVFCEDIVYLPEDLPTTTIPTSPEDLLDAYQPPVLRMFLTLIAIIALAIISVYLFRRISHTKMQKLQNSYGIKILDKKPLSPKTMLYLTEIDGKKILLSESHLQITSLQYLEGHQLNTTQQLQEHDVLSEEHSMP